MSEIQLSGIYRFPVKGFSGHSLFQAVLKPGHGILHDRRFAITNGTASNGEWMPARSYFINAVNDGMQKFNIEFMADENLITLGGNKGQEFSIVLDDPESLEAANAKILSFIEPVGVKHDLPLPKIVERSEQGGHWDFTDTPISIINLNSVKSIEQRLGTKIDVRRFRANLVISGLPAWEEFGLLGMKLKIGTSELEIIRPALRCPATSVDPDTGERDLTVPADLQEHFGHAFCAMYARVSKAGTIKPGDAVSIDGPSGMNHEDAFNERAPDYALWPRMARITKCEVGEGETRFTLESASPWPLQEAKSGQRIRFHLDGPGWTFEEISDASSGQYGFSVEDSQTDDPLTGLLRRGFQPGQKLVISGPYGKGNDA